MFGPRPALPAAVLAATALGMGLASGSARAACNEIPEPRPLAHPFRGVVGTVNLPFGHPDDPNPASPDLRIVELGISGCAATLVPEDPVVTLIFKPPRGTKNVVVLTAQKSCTDLDCCAGLSCDTGESIKHCFGDSDSHLLSSSSGVRFSFPDTDKSFPPAGDKQTFTGPALIAVSPAGSPLPCSLANQRCVDPGRPTGLFACVDELFPNVPNVCETERSDLDQDFPHFTALPVTNDWVAICDVKKPPCLDAGDEVRLAVGKDGTAWQPVDWSGLGPGKSGVEGSTRIPPTAGASPPIRIPTDEFLASFPPTGGPVWPGLVFRKGPDVPGWLVFDGEVDKPGSVLRISRRKPWGYACVGKPHAGQACHPGEANACGGLGTCEPRTSASYFACVAGSKAGSYCTQRQDCPGGDCFAGSACVKISGNPPPPPPPPTPTPACHTDLDCADDEECGLGLFEFRGRLEGNAGPFVIPDNDYKAKVK